MSSARLSVVFVAVVSALSAFGEGFTAKAGDSFKLGLVMGVKVPDAKKGYRWFHAGLPVVAFHDLAAAADIVIDDNAGRRAGGK